jgi:NAD(P)-dependent dehydrogenase (short-subunit alcohol dehydrogenase family)
VTPVPPPFDRFLLTDKVALVTGGSRGLGREMAMGFALAGARVVVASRHLDACQEVVGSIREATGREGLAYACHVGHWDELPGLVDAAYAAFGRVDVLVNNAGMSPPYGDLLEVTEAMWDSVFNLNVKGPFRLASLVGDRMVADGGGSIINVSSTGSIRPTPNIVPYAAAKAGLNALTEALAKAYGPTVRVNTLMAGPFFTDISKAWDMDAVNVGLAQHALGRGGQAPEIVGAALFLASEASSFTTGSVLRADGGIP